MTELSNGSKPGQINGQEGPRVSPRKLHIPFLSKPKPVHATGSEIASTTTERHTAASTTDAFEQNPEAEKHIAELEPDSRSIETDGDRSSHQGSGSSNEPCQDEFEYPEGGLQAWLVTFGAWCALFCGLGLINTIGTLQAYVSRNQLKQYNEATISWIFSIYVFIVFFCGLQIGPIFDKYGPRALIFAGSVLIVLCMEILGNCTAYWHFILVFSLVGGAGSTLLFTPSVSAIAHWFNKKRGNATGLAATGGSVGGIVFPLMLQALLDRIGFAWSCRIIGFVFFFFCIIANILVRSRLPSKTNATVLPSFSIYRDGTGALGFTTAATFFMEWGLFVPVAYLTSYALSNGLDERFSYQLIAIFNAGSCFGRWLPGLFSDYVGRFNTMIITIALCMVTTFVFWLPTAHIFNIGGDAVVPLIVVFSVIFGFCSGSNISLVPACVGQMCGVQEYGRYYATLYTIVSFSTLTGIPIAGALVNAAGGQYWGLIAWTGLCYFISLLCYIVAKGVKVGWPNVVKTVW